MYTLIEKPRKLFFDLLMAAFPASGVIIPIGRDWTPVQLITILSTLILILELIFNKRASIKINTNFLTLFVLFLATCVVSILFKPDTPSITFNSHSNYAASYHTLDLLYLAWMILNLVMVILIYNVIDSYEVFYRALKIMLLSSIFYAFYAYYQYIIVLIFGEGARSLVYVFKEEYLWGPEAIRSPSLSREPLFYSFYLSGIIFLCVSILFKKGHSLFTKIGLPKTTIVWILIINSIAFFSGKPTAGFVSLIVAVSFFLIRNIKFSSRIKVNFLKKGLWYTLIVLPIFVGFIYLNQNRIARRLTSAADMSSGYVRVVSVLEGIDSIKKYPITGYGISNSQFFISTVVIHNMYINLVAETGIIGFLAFMSILLFLWFKISKQSKMPGNSGALGQWFLVFLVAVLIQWMSMHAFSIPIFWFYCGLILTSIKLGQNRPQNQISTNEIIE
ncbi:MAG: hypothetical protein R8N23_00135 [Reichenbachiella sp.]|uniref:O-antigen ligase family protein n=1 Tax=Reichenbachiella sp. TaxID=2184521 RepID=UPI002966DA70|nr:O-antigen ligase family protein [Reichenbachiella sp.]MDW3208241.1 hypothetical protein [Reichenbachiella sp.]